MKNNKIFYGWVNLLVIWIVSLACVVPFYYSFGIAAEGMSVSMGVTMTVVTGAYTMHNFVFALIAPAHGKFVSRCGIKRSMLLGLAVGALGFLALALLSGKSTVLYYIIWMLPVSIFLRYGGSYCSQMCISKWFYRHRGLAMSIYFVAGGLGGYLFTPFFERLNSLYGWKFIWVYLAAACALSFIICLLFLREAPDADAAELQKIDEKSMSFRSTESLTCREAMRNSRFYLVMLILALSQFTMFAVCNTGVQYLSDCGMRQAEAARMIGSFAIISVAGRLAMGFLSDRMPAKLPVALGCVAGGIGMLMMRLYSPETVGIALVLAGLGYGIVIVAPVDMLVDFFGSEDSANIIAWYSLIGSGISAGFSVLFGLIYDAFGSYTYVWSIGLGFFALCTIIAIFITPPRKRQLPKE